MLAAALVVFREVLEAALIVSVVLAATQGIKGRIATVCGGIAAGIIGALIVALFTGQIAGAFAGNGQEYFSAAILFSVTALLTWHIVWMNSHGRTLVQEMRSTCDAVRNGEKDLIVLGVVIALAVLREGAEIVLFMHGMFESGNAGDVLTGFGLGLGSGLVVGAALYWGFTKIPVGSLFTSTNILLMLIAAGMAAKGAGKLIQAGVLPSIQDSVWDTSHILSESSVVGEFLSALIGYMEQPSAMQLCFYAATIFGIMLLMRTQKKAQAVAAK